MMNESFPAYSVKVWEEKAEDALKGKPIHLLNTNTYENIKLKPLYTKHDINNGEVSQFPGGTDYRRGSHTLGYLSEEWKIAQKVEEREGESLRDNLLAAFEKGQSAISFQMDHIHINEFSSLIEGLYTKYPFCMEVTENQSELILQLSKLSDSEKASGYLAADPIVQRALNGTAIKKETYDLFAETIKLADASMPNLKTILVNTSIYHNAGANAVQELALALSAGVHHVQQLLERGLKLETIFSKLVFKFSIGANFFMEIAKLRAARVLWSKVTEAYGMNKHGQNMVISAETSAFTKTVYDPYVNMLRAGNEAFAAVLGGIQFLYVSPFNEPEGASTPFSERIARNTQLILKNEAHLRNITDPAGGSWYIESLTNELAEKAWTVFQEIDGMGGIERALDSGWVEEQITEVFNNRSKDVFTRKKSIIGTNVYASLSDSPLENFESANVKKEGLRQSRLSEPFEKLRRMAEKMELAGNKLAAGLICLGDLKSHKARMDFITGFLAPGGIHACQSQNIDEPAQAVQFVNETNLQHYVICGTDKQYDEFAIEIARTVKEKHSSVKLYLAGQPNRDKQELLKQAGIEGFIHLRSNCFDILSSLLSEMEVAGNE